MTTFTIDTDGNITALPTPEAAQDALALGAQMFTTRKEFTKLASGWPGSRLVEIWNSFAGVAPFDDLKPVNKFTDKKRATDRIWEAIQRLAPAAQEGAQDAPKPAARTKDATAKKGAPKAKKGAKDAGPKKEAAEARNGSKKAIVLELLRRPKGATMAEIAKATAWRSHSIRGFISGHLTKKMGLVVESTKNEAGARTYRVAK
jgi:hypothetical protein